MLVIVKKMAQLDWQSLMTIYREGNLEKAEKYGFGGLQRAEDEFYQYLQESFFSVSGGVYALWKDRETFVSALRLEPFEQGYLVEALETDPSFRNRGYGKALLGAAVQYLKEQGIRYVYSHVSRRNEISLKTHSSCHFQVEHDYARYIDGTVSADAYTLCCRLDEK